MISMLCRMCRTRHTLTGPQVAMVIAALWAVTDDLVQGSDDGDFRNRHCVREVHGWARDTEMYYEYVTAALGWSHDDAEAGMEPVR